MIVHVITRDGQVVGVCSTAGRAEQTRKSLKADAVVPAVVDGVVLPSEYLWMHVLDVNESTGQIECHRSMSMASDNPLVRLDWWPHQKGTALVSQAPDEPTARESAVARLLTLISANRITDDMERWARRESKRLEDWVNYCTVIGERAMQSEEFTTVQLLLNRIARERVKSRERQPTKYRERKPST